MLVFAVSVQCFQETPDEPKTAGAGFAGESGPGI
jgi:hypothetical protein